MPVNAEGHFELPRVEDTLVGRRYYFVQEDRWDGNPTLRQTIVTATTALHGWKRRTVLPGTADDHLGGKGMVVLYPTARMALDEFIAHNHWRFDSLNPQRPGDAIARESIERNVIRLLRSNWKHIEEEARSRLGALLNQYQFSPIPLQEYALGASVQTQDGMGAIVGGIVMKRHIDKHHQPQPPYIQYLDVQGSPITIAEATSL